MGSEMCIRDSKLIMQFPAALTHPGLLRQHTALRKHTQIPLHSHPPMHEKVMFLPPFSHAVIAFFEADCTQVVVALLHGVEKIVLEAIQRHDHLQHKRLDVCLQQLVAVRCRPCAGGVLRLFLSRAAEKRAWTGVREPAGNGGPTELRRDGAQHMRCIAPHAEGWRLRVTLDAVPAHARSGAALGASSAPGTGGRHPAREGRVSPLPRAPHRCKAPNCASRAILPPPSAGRGQGSGGCP